MQNIWKDDEKETCLVPAERQFGFGKQESTIVAVSKITIKS